MLLSTVHSHEKQISLTLTAWSPKVGKLLKWLIFLINTFYFSSPLSLPFPSYYHYPCRQLCKGHRPKCSRDLQCMILYCAMIWSIFMFVVMTLNTFCDCLGSGIFFLEFAMIIILCICCWQIKLEGPQIKSHTVISSAFALCGMWEVEFVTEKKMTVV